MSENQPITSAVYSRRAAAKPKPEQPRRAERLLKRELGPDYVVEIYRKLGFKTPEEREAAKRRKRRST